MRKRTSCQIVYLGAAAWCSSYKRNQINPLISPRLLALLKVPLGEGKRQNSMTANELFRWGASPDSATLSSNDALGIFCEKRWISTGKCCLPAPGKHGEKVTLKSHYLLGLRGRVCFKESLDLFPPCPLWFQQMFSPVCDGCYIEMCGVAYAIGSAGRRLLETIPVLLLCFVALSSTIQGTCYWTCYWKIGNASQINNKTLSLGK